MRTKHQTVAAGHSVELDPARWQELFEELMGRVAGRFARADLRRRRARAFVRGLLADLPRKNCWTIAEHAGHPNPDGMQHLLARAVWDHEGVRDDVRGYVVEHLGDPGAVVPTARLDAPPAFAHQVRSNMPNQATRATTCATLRSVEMPAMPGFMAGRGILSLQDLCPDRW